MKASVLVLNRNASENEWLRLIVKEWEEIDFNFYTDISAARHWVIHSKTPITAVILGANDLSEWRDLRALPMVRSALYYGIGLSPFTKSLDLSVLSEQIVVQPFSPVQFEEKIALLLRSRSGRPGAALFVDETGEARDAICQSLGSMNFLTVYQCEDTPSAIDLLKVRKAPISLIVTSCEKPFRPFDNLKREISSDPKLSNIPLLLLTPRSSIEDWLLNEEMRRTFEAGWLFRPNQETVNVFRERLFTEILRHRQVESFLMEAEIFRARGSFEYGIGILRHAIGLFPNCYALYERLAQIQLSSPGDPDSFEKAAQTLETGLRVKPDEKEGVLLAARIWGRRGRWKESARVLQKYLQRASLDDSVRTLLAQVYLKTGDRIAALVELRRVLAIHRSNHEATQLKNQIETASAPANLFTPSRVTVG